MSPQGSYPNKAVRYINPFPAGGATDTLSRIFCAKMSELSGQQWVVENKGGSGGNVGMDALAQSPADGCTLGLGASPAMRSPPPSTPSCRSTRVPTSPSSRPCGSCPTCWWSISTCRPRRWPS
ncbi:MAG: hypothetical protein GEV13_22470 [Rhodospirillales bacterium]|nr:hypothetical protein [Rhodospirillales bacterium]